MVFLSSVKTALLGQFSPTGAHREDCGPLCEQCCRYPWIASLENTSALSAHKPYKQRSWCRPASFEATGYHVQHKVCLHVEVARRKWVVVSTSYFLSSRRQRQNSRLLQWSSKESMQEVIAWVWGSVTHGNAVEQYTWALTVLIRTLLPEIMAYGHAKVETSCLLPHVLVACTVVELHQPFRRRKPQRWACRVARVLSVGGFDLIRYLDTSLIVFLRGLCSGLGPSEGGIVYGLFSKEALYVGKASVNRTHCPGLAARLTEHIRCLYRPGLKDANKQKVSTSQAQIMGCSFLSTGCLPTISQTLAAEAVAISMEAPMGNAKDAAEERRLRCKGDNAKVRAPRRRPSSWRRRKRRPWESIWGCSAVQEAFSNHFRSKPVLFPGELGLDIPFSLCTRLRYEKSMRIAGLKDLSICLIPAGWGSSWRIARKARTGQTFRGSGCRDGLDGRLRRICMVRANRFPNFSNFPPDSVLHPGFWKIFCGSIPYHRKEFQFFRCLQSSRMLGMSSENSMRLLAACAVGRLVDGCKGSWWCATRVARGGCGSSMARGSSETCSLRSSGDGTSTSVLQRWSCAACEPCLGVWRLPVWEHAEDINSECFSCLGLWSVKTRIPPRTHSQLYGTMCGILESIHQVKAPPALWAELEVPLRAAVR